MNPNLNSDNPDYNNQDPTSMSDDEKKTYMLTYVRTLRINSNTDVFERLLDSGVSPNITSPEGKSLLMLASEKGSIELVQALLDAGADVEQRDRHNKTALFYAVEVANENSDVVGRLLSHKADPTARSYEGKTPLIRAVEKGHCNVAKALLSRGGNIYVTVESTGDTLLHLAAKNEDANMVQMLLAHNADPNRKNKRNQLALDVCQPGGHAMQIIQSVYPKQKPPAPIPDPQTIVNPQMNINAQIHEFMQIKSQQQNLEEEQTQSRQDYTQSQSTQGQQEIDLAKQKQPLQDYRRHQQQQQINQKKSPQHFPPQKVEKEPPTRKYPGKADTSMRRTVSNNEANTGMADSNSSINRTNENITTPGTTPMTNNYTLEVPQNPYDPNQNYNMNPGMDSQGEDMPVQQVPPGYGNRPHEHGKSPEHTNQYQYQNQNQNRQQQQQHQNKKMNIPGASSASEISSTSTTNTERFPERDIPPNLIKTPQGEFMQQFHPQQQQQQGQPQMQAAYMGNPPQMGQMGFNPVQMKGNVSPNMYANPQFFNQSPNPNSNQPYQKRKPKGQMNMQNTNNKNFPINPNQQTNQNNPNAVGQNQPPMGQNQYNRGGNMPPNMDGGRPDQGFQQQQPQSQRGPGNQQGGNKFNKNADRNYQQDNMQQQQQPRGFVSPPGYQQHPNMNPNMNIPGNMPPEVGDVQKMPGEGIVKMPVSARGVEEGGKEPKGGRPQQQQYHHQQQQQQPQGQQQGNMMFSNSSGTIMFNPNFMMDPRMMANNMSNMPGQNQMIFNPNFPQGQPGNINMQNMPQNNFINYSPSMTPSRGQQMMPKGQMMQSPYNYANGVQMNASMDPKVVHLNINDPLQADNMKLSANVHSMLKGINDQVADIEKTKTENKDLRSNLDEMQQNEKTLQEKLREKEKLIEELRKKTEDLELTAKTMSSKAPLVNRQDSSVITDGLLDNFQSTPFEKILQEPKPKADFWKHDDLVVALHEEVLAFEKSVDNYNTEKKNLFDSLVTMIRQTVAEVVTETEFYIYGSFATGLSLPWSDIDIVIKIPQLYYNGYAAILDSIEQNLKKKKWVDDIKIIKNTSVPVLKITCSKSTYTSKKVDISLQDTRHNGLACVELVREYLTFYPALRPLVLILKQFLYRLNLNDTYSGGLSSYGLILMVVYLFQTRELQNSMNPVENQNLGSLLLSFLYFYGFEFDYYNQFLVNPKKIPKGNEITDPFAENMSVINLVNQNPPSIMEPKIIIQDPLSLANNVGRSTFQIKQIKNAFMAAYFEAHKPCICEVHKFIGEIDSIDGKKPVHKCASIFRRMMLSLQPLK